MTKKKLTSKVDFIKGTVIDRKYVDLALDNLKDDIHIMSESYYEDGTARFTIHITYDMNGFEKGKHEVDNKLTANK